ncbi:MAG: hypothetical protein ACR2HH_04930 [Chthoniobacterales bacterium]
MAQPEAELARIVAFLGPDRVPTAARMNSKIEPDLYRRRNAAPMLR